MREISLDELYNMFANARESIWAQATKYGREPRIYLHWTAGWYGQTFADYHVNIMGNGHIYVEKPLDAKLDATYMRNSGSVSIALCCALQANTSNLGSQPPTATQIEIMSKVIAKAATALWLTIDKTHVLTHGEAADNEDGLWPHEPYGPKSKCERWDLEYLGTAESPKFNPHATDGTRGGDVLRGKANWYVNKWKN